MTYPMLFRSYTPPMLVRIDSKEAEQRFWNAWLGMQGNTRLVHAVLDEMEKEDFDVRS